MVSVIVGINTVVSFRALPANLGAVTRISSVIYLLFLCMRIEKQSRSGQCRFCLPKQIKIGELYPVSAGGSFFRNKCGDHPSRAVIATDAIPNFGCNSAVIGIPAGWLSQWTPFLDELDSRVSDLATAF